MRIIDTQIIILEDMHEPDLFQVLHSGIKEPTELRSAYSTIFVSYEAMLLA